MRFKYTKDGKQRVRYQKYGWTIESGWETIPEIFRSKAEAINYLLTAYTIQERCKYDPKVIKVYGI